jgi:hypothetical protein
MKGLTYYYAAFQHELDAFDARAGEEFKIFSGTHSPRDVFLWLEERRKSGRLPTSLEGLLTDFYWEIT